MSNLNSLPITQHAAQAMYANAQREAVKHVVEQAYHGLNDLIHAHSGVLVEAGYERAEIDAIRKIKAQLEALEHRIIAKQDAEIAALTDRLSWATTGGPPEAKVSQGV